MAANSLWTIVTDYIVWILTGLTGLVGGYTRRVEAQIDTVDERSARNERRIEGDSDDPNNPGLMTLAYENAETAERTREEVRELHDDVEDLRDKMQDHHDDVMDAIENSSDD